MPTTDSDGYGKSEILGASERLVRKQNFWKIKFSLSEYSEKIMKPTSIWGKVFDFGTDPHMDEYNNLCEGSF